MIRALLVGIAICIATPGLARSAPAMYTGSVHVRIWGIQIPYGAALDYPGVANAPPGHAVSLVGGGPAGFALASRQLTLATSMVDPSPPATNLDFRSTRFTAENDAGNFFAGGGPAAATFQPMTSIPASQFGASFSGGQGFGGVMKLLGQFDWTGELGPGCGFCPFRTAIPLSPIGGPPGGTATATAYLGDSLSSPTLVTATVWGFPWGTGAVGAVANVTPTYSATTTAAAGTDQRTASGMGTLQLVTPFLVRVKSHPPACGGCENRWYYAGTARTELHFVPEPGALVMLAAGLGVLVAVSRKAKR
jgi:hypothetical protein